MTKPVILCKESTKQKGKGLKKYIHEVKARQGKYESYSASAKSPMSGANTPIEPMATPRPAALLLDVLAVELVFEALDVPALLALAAPPATLPDGTPVATPVGTPVGALVPVAPLIWACSVVLN